MTSLLSDKKEITKLFW